MTVKVILLWIILARAVYCNASCHSGLDFLQCTEIKWPDFLHDFFSLVLEEDIAQLQWIAITNSKIPTMDYFPRLHSTFNITKLVIENCSLERISEGAFQELEYLQTLDLSHNSLKNIYFIESLPSRLQTIDLSYNRVMYLDNVFHSLKNLKHLSLSHNNLSIVDMNNTIGIRNLNVSFNNISALIGGASSSHYDTIDLSHNNLKTFSEYDLLVRVRDLDISYNKIKQIHAPHTVVLKYSGNKEFNFQLPKLEKLYLSDTPIPKLKESIIELKSFRAEIIQLSNCSITKISKNYFHDFDMGYMDLSYNNIKFIEEGSFSDCKFTNLDLSHSQLKTAQHAFVNMWGYIINLSNNNITNAKNIFSSVSVHYLDISYNPIKVLFKSTFIGCTDMATLILSNCQIEFIERNSFEGLANLEKVDLSHNRIQILEPGTFQNLPVEELILDGNQIHTLRNGSFRNMESLKKLNLSQLCISELDSNTFSDLPALESIDLSRNNISTIPDNLFVNCENLREVFLHGNCLSSFSPFSNKLKIKSISLSFNYTILTSKIANINLNEIKILDSYVPLLKNNSFKGLYNLHTLDCQNVVVEQIEGGAFQTLYNLKDISSKELFKTVKKIKFNTFKGLRSLNDLDLSGLSIVSLETGAFIGLNSLEYLHLDHNNISELNKSTFVGLDSLCTLDLSFNYIGNISSEMLVGIGNLRELYLQNNNISLLNADSLNELPLLEKLSLRNNCLQTLDKELFVNNGDLLWIHLEQNRIKELPVGIFEYLSNLKVLNMSSNKLAIISIGIFSNLKSLEVLDLSNNELVTLEHASAFYSSKNLRRLYLDNNHLKLFDFDRSVSTLISVFYPERVKQRPKNYPRSNRIPARHL
ncbi:unnamed protein product [Acanthoscelides obtectus]|uniref:Uncharacterized protein n=1 Tax=Acanthoscelides obtectus TaxID=200917 RepID=A0A9P0KF29_ACAOB|nr:unnamed protein product [Acanthoscelides obtectus]CAK1642590.1 Insulin-like growth factor-binding protein complex acid labile subunit [Acanthoscelides obtectus]